MGFGVICEVVSVVAQVEKEEKTLTEVKEKLIELTPELDSDGDGMVSLKELQLLVYNPEAVKILDEVGVDVFALVEFGDILFKEKAEISFGEMISQVMQFRDSNNATLKDLYDVKKLITRELHEFE